MQHCVLLELNASECGGRNCSLTLAFVHVQDTIQFTFAINDFLAKCFLDHSVLYFEKVLFCFATELCVCESVAASCCQSVRNPVKDRLPKFVKQLAVK